MADVDVKKAFLEATEIASKLPKHLQEIGFNRALDHLLGKNVRDNQRETFSSRSPRQHESMTKEDGEFGKLLNAINRTEHPDVGSTTRVADRALKVLELVIDKCGVDGMTALQISEILTRKFRLPVTTNSVNMALERETGTVDIRHSANGVKVFHLMAPGEEYLRRLRTGESPARRRQLTATTIAERKTTNKEKANGRNAPKVKPVNTAQKRQSSRPGPKAAVGQLIAAGFFKTARIITGIQEELKHNKGHTYSVQELAPALVRSLRGGSLCRSRNSSGQYEYSEA